VFSESIVGHHQLVSVDNINLRVDSGTVRDWYNNLLSLISVYKDMYDGSRGGQCEPGHVLAMWDGIGRASHKYVEEGSYNGMRVIDNRPHQACTDFIIDIFYRGMKLENTGKSKNEANTITPQNAICLSKFRATPVRFFFLQTPMKTPPQAGAISQQTKTTHPGVFSVQPEDTRYSDTHVTHEPIVLRSGVL
jgi:hypothetical protein